LRRDFAIVAVSAGVREDFTEILVYAEFVLEITRLREKIELVKKEKD
jgi:hypothetical protein